MALSKRVRETDLEKAYESDEKEAFPDFDPSLCGPFPEYDTPASPSPLSRFLPAHYVVRIRHAHSIWLYYWHYPIPFPDSVENRITNVRTWWAHPLKPYLPPATNARFETWWIAPEDIWKKRRLRYVIWFTVLLYTYAIYFFATTELPRTEAAKTARIAWDENSKGCHGLECVKAAWDSGKAVFDG